MKPSVCYLLIHVWLFVTLWTVAHQAPLPIGFSRQEYWSGLPFPSPGIFLSQGLNPGLLKWGRFFTIWASREAQWNLTHQPGCQFNIEKMPSWDLIVIPNLFTWWFSNTPTSFCTLASWLRFASYNTLYHLTFNTITIFSPIAITASAWHSWCAFHLPVFAQMSLRFSPFPRL